MYLSEFNPSFPLKNGHLGTIWPTLFRKGTVDFERTRMATEDGDFIDLDWVARGNAKLLIIGHGLEGSSASSYVVGLTKNAIQQGFDVMAINWRGCSGQSNLKFESYHTGKSADLKEVIAHICQQYSYPAMYYTGFSMGGNIGLKYAGEESEKLPPQLNGICAISTPVDLESSSYQLAKSQNKVYMYRFLRTLKAKYLQKVAQFPEKKLDTKKILAARTFLAFDQYFTAPANGFESAQDYWTKSSSKPFLKRIHVPTLILNAKNDPFLAPACFPYSEVSQNPFLEMLTPKFGGHVGFVYAPRQLETTWAEHKILEFFTR